MDSQAHSCVGTPVSIQSVPPSLLQMLCPEGQLRPGTALTRHVDQLVHAVLRLPGAEVPVGHDLHVLRRGEGETDRRIRGEDAQAHSR